eukprot:1284698-Alexandrium_andersonii.AAC.1
MGVNFCVPKPGSEAFAPLSDGHALPELGARVRLSDLDGRVAARRRPDMFAGARGRGAADA